MVNTVNYHFATCDTLTATFAKTFRNEEAGKMHASGSDSLLPFALPRYIEPLHVTVRNKIISNDAVPVLRA